MQITFEQTKQDFELLSEILKTLDLYESEFQPTILRILIGVNNVEVYFDNNQKILFGYEIFEKKTVFTDFVEEAHNEEPRPYSDEIIRRMAKELSSKTKLLKKFKKKWRKAYTLNRLQKILDAKKSQQIDYRDYQNFEYYDEAGYVRATSKLEAEVALLEDLIASKQKKRWLHY